MSLIIKICIVLTFFIAICYQQSNIVPTSKVSTKPKNPRINVGFKYHNYEELTKLLKSIVKRFPSLARLYSIGKSVEGRELWVMHLTE